MRQYQYAQGKFQFVRILLPDEQPVKYGC